MRIAFLEQFKKNNCCKNILNRQEDTKDTRKLLKKIK